PETDAEETLTKQGQLIGTPQYMSPEQAAFDTDNIDTRSDIYSIGAVLFEVLTGRPVFENGPLLRTLNQIQSQDPPIPSRITSGLHVDLSAICLKCLEKEPNARYGTVNELRQDLERFLENKPVHARRSTALGRVLKWAKRSPLTATLCASLAVAFTALLVGWAWFTVQLQYQRDEIAATASELEQQREHAFANFRRAHLAIQESLTIRTHTPLGISDKLRFQKHLLESGIEFYDELLKDQGVDFAGDEYAIELASARIQHARLHFEYGKVLLGGRENSPASDSFKQALVLLKPLAENGRTGEIRDEATQLQGVVATSMVKVLRRLGEYQAALRVAEDGLKRYQSLIDQGVLAGDYQHWYLAISHHRIGQLYSDMKQIEQARRSFEQALQHAKRLPGIFDFQLTHCNVLLDIGVLSRVAGELEASLVAIDEALKIAVDICVRSTPPALRYQMARIRCLKEKAICFSELGRTQDSFATYEEAIQFQEALLEAQPHSEQFALGLAGLKERFAAAMRRVDQNEGKSSELLESAARLRSNLDARTEEPETLLLIARMRLDSAAHHLEYYSFASAAQHFQESLDLLERLGPEFRASQVDELKLGAHFRLATTHFFAMQFQAAIKHYEAYFSSVVEVADEHKTAYAVCLAAVGKCEEAIESTRGIDVKLPNSNELVAYLPVIKMMCGDTAAAAESELRDLVQLGDSMSDPQKMFVAFALCLALEHTSDSESFKSDGFESWARAEAVRFLKQTQPLRPIEFRELSLDRRLAILSDRLQQESTRDRELDE
ncbi:MAG: tetratricopeptide repeat-containing protein kinase family protein, partial [Planctomycetota bacterium]